MTREVIQRVADNRVFLIGFDQHYRDAMKLFEAKVLLPHVEALAARLGVREVNAPLEGYYAEGLPGLDRDFRLMRALQKVTAARGVAAKGTPELARLLEITASALYGRAQFERNNELMMLPTGRDPLSQAMSELPLEPDLWTVAELVPPAAPESAEHFWHAADDDDIAGRCTHLGTRGDTDEMYHWAVRYSLEARALEVHEFWHKEMWTTERYREAHRLEPPRPRSIFRGGGIDDLDVV